MTSMGRPLVWTRSEPGWYEVDTPCGTYVARRLYDHRYGKGSRGMWSVCRYEYTTGDPDVAPVLVHLVVEATLADARTTILDYMIRDEDGPDQHTLYR